MLEKDDEIFYAAAKVVLDKNIVDKFYVALLNFVSL